QTDEANSRSVAESIEDSPFARLEYGDAPKWDSPEVPASTREITGEPKALIAEINSLVNATPARIIEARDKLNEMLSTPLSRQQSAFVKKQFSSLGANRDRITRYFEEILKRWNVGYEAKQLL
ncbi:hypothetical protein IIB49_01410, partial [Patescibacteria group bacterium]|nr:hypothetical protein [Patescibacteria group bacterium]